MKKKTTTNNATSVSAAVDRFDAEAKVTASLLGNPLTPDFINF